MMKTQCLKLFIVLGMLCCFAQGGEGPSAAPAKTRMIRLADVLQMALQANTEIRVRQQDAIIADEEIQRAKSKFDPRFDVSANRQTGRRPSAFSTTKPQRDEVTMNAEAAITKKLQTGATVVGAANYNLSRGNEGGVLLNPLHASAASLTITQPLLKGAGMFVNRSNILLAENASQITRDRFERTVTDVLAEAEAAYWEFVERSKNLEDQLESLKLARSLADQNQQRFKAGEIALVDLLESDRAAAKREVLYSEARSAVVNAEAKLKGITNFEEAVRGFEPVWSPLDSPKFARGKFDVDDEILRGLENRSDFQAAILDLKSQDISVRVAKDALKPVLNLEAGIATEGIAGTNRGLRDAAGNTLLSPFEGNASTMFDNLVSGGTTRWNVGVILSVPWGFRDEKANVEQRRAVARQAFERLIRAERSVIREVRTAVKQIEIQQGRAAKAAVHREYAEKLVSKSNEQLRIGVIDTQRIVIMMDNLAEARLIETRAMSDFVLALTELERATGTLLRNRGVQVSYTRTVSGVPQYYESQISREAPARAK